MDMGLSKPAFIVSVLPKGKEREGQYGGLTPTFSWGSAYSLCGTLKPIIIAF